MPDTPRRVSLVAQSCELLRRWISEGVWQDLLPGEAELGRRLRVSRVTLRAALQQLQREGLLRSAQGKRREILRPRTSRKATHEKLDRVILLSPVAQARLTAWKLLWIDELREELTGMGLGLEFLASGALLADRPGKALQDLVSRHKGGVWVLLQSAPMVQQWFAAAGLRVVVAGSRTAESVLPCVDLDYHAICRHAAGRLIARGCSTLGLVIPRLQLAGDRESEAGFVEGAADHPVRIARHDGTPDGLCRTLEALVAAPAPDGLLVCHSTHAVTVLTWLLHHGWRVPRQIRLISRDDDLFLEHVTPALSRYTLQPAVYASHVARRVRQLLSSAGDSRPDLLLPEFCGNETA